MIKKITKYGNSHALILDKPILKLMRIDEHVQLELTTDGKSLIITPIREKKIITVRKNKSVQRALKKALVEHDATFKKLARHDS